MSSNKFNTFIIFPTLISLENKHNLIEIKSSRNYNISYVNRCFIDKSNMYDYDDVV